MTKPWLLQKDEDLWQQYWKVMLMRNPLSVKHGKVKGHATDEMVASGKTREEDKRGNDHGDAAAGEGVKCIGGATKHIAFFYKHRQKQYTELATKIMQSIVAVGKAAQKERKEKDDWEAAQKQISGKKDNKVEVKRLKYGIEDKARNLMWTPFNCRLNETGECKEELKRIYRFLTKLKWQGVEAREDVESKRRHMQHEEQPGSSWIEMMVLYEMHGGHEQKKADKRVRRITGKKRVDEATKKDLGEKRKNEKKRTAQLHKELEAFKKKVRKVTAECLINEDADLFRCSKSPINRLMHLGITNKPAAIRANPVVENEDTNTIMEHILRQRGDASKDDIERLRRGTLSVQARKFKTRTPIRWRGKIEVKVRWVDKSGNEMEEDSNGRKIPLTRIWCPKCREEAKVNDRKLTNGTKWSLIKCHSCCTAWSARNWTCDCGIKWHRCGVHRHMHKARHTSDQAGKGKQHVPMYGNDKALPHCLRNETHDTSGGTRVRRQVRYEVNDSDKARAKKRKIDEVSWTIEEKVRRTIRVIREEGKPSEAVSHSECSKASSESQPSEASRAEGNKAAEAEPGSRGSDNSSSVMQAVNQIERKLAKAAKRSVESVSEAKPRKPALRSQATNKRKSSDNEQYEHDTHKQCEHDVSVQEHKNRYEEEKPRARMSSDHPGQGQLQTRWGPITTPSSINNNNRQGEPGLTPLTPGQNISPSRAPRKSSKTGRHIETIATDLTTTTATIPLLSGRCARQKKTVPMSDCNDNEQDNEHVNNHSHNGGSNKDHNNDSVGKSEHVPDRESNQLAGQKWLHNGCRTRQPD